MKLLPPPQHLTKEGCCVVRDCWATATVQRTRYDGDCTIDYCPTHSQQARRVFGDDRRIAA